MGHTYGHRDVWQMTDHWHDVLDSEGARSMEHPRALMESRPAAGRQPVQTLIGGSGGLFACPLILLCTFMESSGVIKFHTERDQYSKDAREYRLLRMHRAITGPDGNYALVYLPHCDTAVDINADTLSGDTIHAWWHNPRDGYTYNHEGDQILSKPFMTFPRRHMTQSFNPPGSMREHDWVRVLDDAARNYPPPGQPRHQKNVYS